MLQRTTTACSDAQSQHAEVPLEGFGHVSVLTPRCFGAAAVRPAYFSAVTPATGVRAVSSSDPNRGAELDRIACVMEQ